MLTHHLYFSISPFKYYNIVMDCKTIAEDKNKIFYTYFNTLDIILANVLNRFSSIHNLNGNKFYITILLVPSLE